MAVNAAIHSSVPPSILQALSQISLQETTVLFNLDSDSSAEDRAVRRLDSAAMARIDNLSEMRNAFLAALKVGELVQGQSLLEFIR